MVSSGVGFDSLEGSVLVNSSTTPPLSAPGFIGIQFDHPVTSLRFDYAGPTLLVDAFLGGFTSADLIATRQFVPAIGSTGFSEGTVEILIPGGFDRIIVAEGREPVAIDNVSVNFLPE